MQLIDYNGSLLENVNGTLTDDEDCCCECLPPTASCYVIDETLYWEVMNADTATITNDCDEDPIELTLDEDGDGSGTIDATPGCVYTLTAVNSCEDAISVCNGCCISTDPLPSTADVTLAVAGSQCCPYIPSGSYYIPLSPGTTPSCASGQLLIYTGNSETCYNQIVGGTLIVRWYVSSVFITINFRENGTILAELNVGFRNTSNPLTAGHTYFFEKDDCSTGALSFVGATSAGVVPIACTVGMTYDGTTP